MYYFINLDILLIRTGSGPKPVGLVRVHCTVFLEVLKCQNILIIFFPIAFRTYVCSAQLAELCDWLGYHGRQGEWGEQWCGEDCQTRECWISNHQKQAATAERKASAIEQFSHVCMMSLVFLAEECASFYWATFCLQVAGNAEVEVH